MNCSMNTKDEQHKFVQTNQMAPFFKAVLLDESPAFICFNFIVLFLHCRSEASHPTNTCDTAALLGLIRGDNSSDDMNEDNSETQLSRCRRQHVTRLSVAPLQIRLSQSLIVLVSISKRVLSAKMNKSSVLNSFVTIKDGIKRIFTEMSPYAPL